MAQSQPQKIITRKFLCNDEFATEALARELSRVLKSVDIKSLFIALYGDLGTGKTVFSRCLVREFCGLETIVPSPTFAIIQPYENSIIPIWHMDLYRLNDDSELNDLGIFEAMNDHLLIVEWPENMARFLPNNRLEIRLSSAQDEIASSDDDHIDSRSIELSLFGQGYPCHQPLNLFLSSPSQNPITIDSAIIFAAGLGSRMAPLTDQCPKAMVPVCDKPLIGWVIDRLKEQKIENIITNTHHFADQITQYLGMNSHVRFSHEEELLETGGGAQKALPLINRESFFAINADSLWLDDSPPSPRTDFLNEW